MRAQTKTFSNEIKERIWNKYHFLCANLNHKKCLKNKGLSIHHIIANKNVNASIYGDDKLQSEENGILLCNWCHDHHREIDIVIKKEKELKEKWNASKM